MTGSLSRHTQVRNLSLPVTRASWPARNHLAALLLLTVLFAVLVFRAAHQSVSIDEAYTSNLYLQGPFSAIFVGYSPANHVLHTVLCWVSIHLFGFNDLALRIPCLLGALLYFVSVYRLARWALGNGFLSFLTIAWLTVNPFVLDYLCIARGYSLALWCFIAALNESARYLHQQSVQVQPATARLSRVGCLLGLAVGANVTIAVPSVLLLAALAVATLFFAGGIRSALPRLRTLAFHCFVPAFLVSFIITVIPLSQASGAQFYYGAANPLKSMETIVLPSLATGNLSYVSPELTNRYMALVVKSVPFFFSLPLFCLWPLAAVLRSSLSGLLKRHDLVLLLSGFLLFGCAAVLVLAHYALGVLYPLDRTGLYFVPLAGFCLACSIAWYWTRSRYARVAGTAVAVGMSVCVLAFVLASHVDYYTEWKFDAGTRNIVNLIRASQSHNPQSKVSVGANWLFEPALNYYRWRYRIDWMPALTRAGPDHAYDFYVLLPEDEAIVARRNLHVVYRDRVSGALLAAASTHLSPVN